MKTPDQAQLSTIESISSMESEKDKYLQFGKFTKNCPAWLLDKISTIDNSKIDEAYVENVLRLIADEFDPSKHQTTSTNDIRISRFITANDILEKRQASCGSMATVVASVLRSLKIPTKLIHGMYIKNNPNMCHAWNEVSLRNNEWTPYDITRNDFKLDKFHIKKFEALDWEEFEQGVDKF
jgi:transglutaminase/protease-like cytokinesis protein 3